MKGVVSFTIFGNAAIYTQGALKQALLFNSYSDSGPIEWDLRFYVGKSVNQSTVLSLIELGAEIIDCDGPEDQTATFWRFDAFKYDYSHYLIRDTDSRLCPREIAAINQWIDSGRPFHVMRDHPYHGVPILAGLWGATHEVSSEIAERLPMVPHETFYEEINRGVNHTHYESNDFYQVDQWWLRREIYPMMRRRCVAHDEWFRMERSPERRKFPTHRGPGEFVGKGWTENDEERFPEHSLLVDGPRKVG